jgi:glycosyltransferase involved in cell wall biosynthesis
MMDGGTKPDSLTVTVITPCYNGARFIERTIQSALAQSRPPLEIIVVDDGSTDESAALAEAFGPPVRVVRQANKGESVARNRALAEARGSHVLFLDADDLLQPEALAHLTRALEGQPGAVALMGCSWFSDDPTAPYDTRVPRAPSFFPAIIESNLAPPHCWLSPVEVIRQAGGFFAELRWYEDWDLWWRVAMLGPPLVPVAYVGALYRRHQGSQLATIRLVDQMRGHAILMGRMAPAIVARPDLLDAHGKVLLWSCFNALSRARSRRIPWQELDPLVAALHDVVRKGPPTVRRSRLAWSMRLLGVRTATTVRGYITPPRD